MVPRQVLYTVIALVAGLGGAWGILAWGSGPSLWSGDRLEERTCLRCSGRGCDVCGNDGKVRVIVPGPRRPVLIAGDVYEKKVRYPGGRNWSIQWVRTPMTPSMAPMPGFVPGAQVAISRKGEGRESIDVCSDENGRFHAELRPGRYEVRVTARGFRPLAREIEVDFGGPIWLEDRPLAPDLAWEATKKGIARGRGDMDLGLGLTAENEPVNGEQGTENGE